MVGKVPAIALRAPLTSLLPRVLVRLVYLIKYLMYFYNICTRSINVIELLIQHGGQTSLDRFCYSTDGQIDGSIVAGLRCV